MEITAVVVRASDQAVLMLPSGLPRVEFTEKVWFPDVEPVLNALAGIEAAVLTCLSEEPMTYLMVSTGAVPDDARWVHDVDDPAVVAARQHLALPADSPVTPAWTMPDWYDEALPWIAEHVAGSWTQVRSWGLSNVLRINGDVYFKALAHSSTIRPAGPDALPLLFAHEPLLLHKLSEDRPGSVPEPLAIDEKRAWMLLPDLGPPLAGEADIAVWIDALQGHARLQRSYVDQMDRLFEFSCVDRRLAVLEAELDRLLGPNPATDRLEPAERALLPRRAEQLREAITELAAIGVPETLLHGDLHPRNVAVRDGRALSFDWTDGSVSHPFLDLVTFAEERSPISQDKRLTDAYLAEWEEFASPADLRRALELANELGALHQTMTSLHLPDHLSGPSRESMFRGAVWWLRQLLKQ
ncbi:aminoglycoside phosphotransferase family protein [Kribbella sp. NPDC026596]|uniref:aminoglycoside phosphotransferase family protein n=1 Tax=Kribbella sp. NPDC026596 TaxID=3155122 RepID=UPI003408A32B